ncbi:hypothetical protein P171DRAFT_191030 [Karstenula rhodostoma CBS 690.94]|uniref:Uncharacterized protein n=1 Tax=Karstenula rhodostoma CBS 690.94 TaxID=1392251 RepID=A0A9P4UHK5_9PLEO|nr:hypothetical protein P171DRAFT_191030 [Karstenula rhodostoma CBS 690.94]
MTKDFDSPLGFLTDLYRYFRGSSPVRPLYSYTFLCSSLLGLPAQWVQQPFTPHDIMVTQHISASGLSLGSTSNHYFRHLFLSTACVNGVFLSVEHRLCHG